MLLEGFYAAQTWSAFRSTDIMLHLKVRNDDLVTEKLYNFVVVKVNDNMPFDSVTCIQTCNKCVNYRLKIQAFAQIMAKTLKDFLAACNL